MNKKEHYHFSAPSTYLIKTNNGIFFIEKFLPFPNSPQDMLGHSKHQKSHKKVTVANLFLNQWFKAKKVVCD